MPQSVTVRLAIAFLRAEGIEPTKERIQQKRDEILEKKMRLRTSLTPEEYVLSPQREHITDD